MKIFARRCFLAAFLVLQLEIIETEGAYKLIRPYKYYQRRPWWQPRWHTGYKSSKFHHFKRIPPEDYYSHRPSYYRYRSTSDDLDEHVENQAYTIVIQLPKGDGKNGHGNYLERKRNYERDSIPVYANENDYIDEEEDIESRVVNVNNKRVQIKMIKGNSPKLHIKISRSDDDRDIEILDKSNITTMDSPLPPITHTNLTMSMQQSRENWTSSPYLQKRLRK